MNNLDWKDKTKQDFEIQMNLGAILELLGKWLFKQKQSHIMLLFTCKPILHYREMALCFYLVERLLSKGAHYMESLFYCVQQINKWEAQCKK